MADSGNYRYQMYGFGTDTRGAWGDVGTDPVFLVVTNCNDSGAGSLRAACEGALPPRVVIFETSGTIHLQSPIAITSDYITIAGQTAPSPGITVAHFEMEWLSANHGVFQHFRVRLGMNASEYASDNVCVWQTGSYLVLDHMTLSWSAHMMALISGTNCAMWRCFIIEGMQTGTQLRSNGIPSTVPGFDGNARGVAIQNYATSISILQTLFAHNDDRNPMHKGGNACWDGNNLIYDFGTLASTYLDPEATGVPIACVNHSNYYKAGPSTQDGYPAVACRNMVAGAELYDVGHTYDGGSKVIDPFWIIASEGIDPRVGSAPISAPAGYTPMASALVQEFVLANSGARPLDRDVHDTRIVSEVTNRTGSIISHQDDVGGYPSLAENTRSLIVPTNPHAVAAGQAFRTNAEMWLEGFAEDLEPVGEVVPPTDAVLTLHLDASTVTDLWTVNTAGVFTVHPADGATVPYVDDVDHGPYSLGSSTGTPTWEQSAPLMRLPTIAFDGASNYIIRNNADSADVVAGDVLLDTDFLCFAAIYVESVDAGSTEADDGAVFNNDAIWMDDGGTVGLALRNNAGSYSIQGYTYDGTFDSVSQPILLNTPYFVIFMQENGQLILSLNADPLTITTMARGPLDTVAYKMYVGRSYGLGFFTGRLGELKFYQGVMAGPAFVNEIAYFMGKWITGAPVVQQPAMYYYAMARAGF